MSTRNFTNDPIHNADRQRGRKANLPNSRSRKGKSAMIKEMSTELTDPIFEHLSRTCSVRELMQLQCVSKTWKMLVSNNMPIAAKARLEDETKDWYFPVYFKKETCNISTRTKTRAARKKPCSTRRGGWTWSGIHHSSEDLHFLPPPHVPQFCSGTSNGGLRASSGGLVLVSVNQMTLHNWRSLLVWNPVTNHCRDLPAVDCLDVGFTWSQFNSAQFHMMVDEETNSYKVFITFRTMLCVFSSWSNSWNSRAFLEPVPWGLCPESHRPFHKILDSASAIVGGKLFYAELEVGGIAHPSTRAPQSELEFRTHGSVRVFEIDEESSTWKPPIRYTLSSYFPQSPNEKYGFEIGSFGIRLVDCMGGLYAIIPASLHGPLTFEGGIVRTHAPAPGHDNVEGHHDVLGYLPLQFYILKLQGGVGLDLGQLLIENPCTSGMIPMHWKDVEFRHTFAAEYLESCLSCDICEVSQEIGGWFRCTARGNVIWVRWWDYLLQYDVMSGQSQTKILRDPSVHGNELDFSYRPTVHMTP